MSYSALAAIAIQSNQNDQHGGQSIPAFDYYLAPGVLKTFKKQFKQALYELLDFSDFISFVNMDKLEVAVDKLNSINVDLEEFSNFKEVNLFLRGMFPLIGYKTDIVYYERAERFAGESKYPLKKMLNFAWNGITSFSVKPIRLILNLGISILVLSIITVIY